MDDNEVDEHGMPVVTDVVDPPIHEDEEVEPHEL